MTTCKGCRGLVHDMGRIARSYASLIARGRPRRGQAKACSAISTPAPSAKTGPTAPLLPPRAAATRRRAGERARLRRRLFIRTPTGAACSKLIRA